MHMSQQMKEEILPRLRHRYKEHSRRGRPSIYGTEVIQVLKSIWEAAQQPCGKRTINS